MKLKLYIIIVLSISIYCSSANFNFEHNHPELIKYIVNIDSLLDQLYFEKGLIKRVQNSGKKVQVVFYNNEFNELSYSEQNALKKLLNKRQLSIMLIDSLDSNFFSDTSNYRVVFKLDFIIKFTEATIDTFLSINTQRHYSIKSSLLFPRLIRMRNNKIDVSDFNYSNAYIYLDQKTHYDPEYNIDLEYTLAEYYYRKEDYKRVDQILSNILKIDTTYYNAYFLKATLYEKIVDINVPVGATIRYEDKLLLRLAYENYRVCSKDSTLRQNVKIRINELWPTVDFSRDHIYTKTIKRIKFSNPSYSWINPEIRNVNLAKYIKESIYFDSK